MGLLKIFPRLVSHQTLRAPKVDTIYKRPSCKRSATVFSIMCFSTRAQKTRGWKTACDNQNYTKCVLMV